MEGGKTCNTDNAQAKLERAVGEPKCGDARSDQHSDEKAGGCECSTKETLIFAGSTRCLWAYLQRQYLATACENQGTDIQLQSECRGMHVPSLDAYAFPRTCLARLSLEVVAYK